MKKRLIVEDDRWTLAAPGARLKSANGEFLAFAAHNPDLTVANSQMNGLGVAAEEIGVGRPSREAICQQHGQTRVSDGEGSGQSPKQVVSRCLQRYFGCMVHPRTRWDAEQRWFTNFSLFRRFLPFPIDLTVIPAAP